MEKHTKGPWEVDTRGVNRYGVVGQTAFVADCAPRPGGPMYPEQCEANARLIAAAPELLEALDNAAASLETMLLQFSASMTPADQDGRSRVLTSARASIAKTKAA